MFWRSKFNRLVNFIIFGRDNSLIMEVKRACPDDVAHILEIVNQARNIMRESGNITQWTSGYPSKEIILNDILQGHGFICVVDEEVVGYFCFMKGEDPDPNYQIIEKGNWLNDFPYGVIHRLASGRKVKGIAQKAFDFAFSQSSNIRVDTHHDNIPMQTFLAKAGFTYCGVIYVADGTPRDAFQKQLC